MAYGVVWRRMVQYGPLDSHVYYMSVLSVLSVLE